jgi:hypothetical protein
MSVDFARYRLPPGEEVALGSTIPGIRTTAAALLRERLKGLEPSTFCRQVAPHVSGLL